MEDIRQQSCMKARTMVDNGQERARTTDLESLIVFSGSSITIEEGTITTRIPREALREMSLSDWPSFTEDLQLVQEAVLISTYSIPDFDTFYNFHLGISTPLTECTVKYLGSDAIHSHPRKPVPERMPLSRMPMSLLREVNLTLSVIEGDY